MTYTEAAITSVVLVGATDQWVLRTRLLRRRVFWVSYGIILFFQLVVNGVLTGLPVVRYNPATIIGLRIGYAPVEDLLFGFAMVLLTLSLWVVSGGRDARSGARVAERPPSAEHPDRH